MDSIERKVAKCLLDVEAVQLNAEKPFLWASGWLSPIYCDNRKILSYPKVRETICKYLVDIIEKNFKSADVIAGVATGAIAWGAIVAEMLGKPFVYVRPKPKDHGTGAQIEGRLPADAKVVVIEDLISTGQSSLSAIDVLRKAGAVDLGMVAIFSYNFTKARRSFEYSNVELRTLSNYDALIEEAAVCDYIKEDDMELLKAWRLSPETWGQER